MFSELTTTQRSQPRFSKLRGVLLVMIMFVVYFAVAKPATAAALAPVATTTLSMSASISHQHDAEHDASLPCEDCGGQDPDADDESSVEVDMDEFVATLPHLNLLFHVSRYEIEDLHLSLPSHDRGLEYPPDALI